MGVKQSKLVINGAKKETAATHDETPGTCKELNENGTIEAAAGDATQHQETANCEGDAAAAPADQSTTVSGEEAKAHKKKNPINWIQKKISIKKPRVCSKTEAAGPEKEEKTETPAEEGEGAKVADPLVPPVEQAPAPETHEAELQQPPAEETATESKWINAPSADACAEISTQAEPVVTKDQSAGFGGDSNDFGQIVEITPTVNGHHHLMGDEHLELAEPACQPFEEPTEPASDDLPVDSGLSEKLASLGIDGVPEQALTNGHDAAAANGHCVLTADEETTEN